MAINIPDNPNPAPNYMREEIFANPLILDADNSNTFYCLLTGDITLRMINTRVGGTYLIQFVMDGVGGHTVTFGSPFRWLIDRSGIIDTTAGAINLISAIVLEDEYLAYNIMNVTSVTTSTTTT